MRPTPCTLHPAAYLQEDPRCVEAEAREDLVRPGPTCLAGGHHQLGGAEGKGGREGMRVEGGN